MVNSLVKSVAVEIEARVKGERQTKSIRRERYDLALPEHSFDLLRPFLAVLVEEFQIFVGVSGLHYLKDFVIHRAFFDLDEI